MTFVPSVQQTAVLEWVPNGSGNAFVEAVAGAGKTTTLVQACKLLQGSVAFAAYNKKIATEVEGRLKPLGFGPRVRVGTFHSFGFTAWRRIYPGVKAGPQAARDKADAMIQELDVKRPHQSAVLKLVSLAKQSAVGVEWDPKDDAGWLEIVDRHDLACDLEDPRDLEKVIKHSQAGLAWSIEQARDVVDFDDMIFMPIHADVHMWRNDWVLVDEAQDTNPARRVLASKMLSTGGRAIFVGDRAQAIYGFTGADNDAIDRIVNGFQCTMLPLTTTYRCPKAVVAEARRFVDHIEAHSSAPEGSVTYQKGTDFMKGAKALRAADAILCRKTRPLVSLAFKLLKMGVPCHVEGKDIGNGLIALATRWKSAETIADLSEYLGSYREAQVAKLISQKKETQAEALSDRVETLFVLMEGCDTVQCVVDKIKRMFEDTEGNKAATLTLSTVHKAKGREWQRVYILGYDEFMPSPWAKQEWQLDQERNLQYVAVTRAQSELILLPELDEYLA